MIVKIKIWYLKKAIGICTYALQFSGAADDQNAVNGVIEARNYFMRELRLISWGSER